MALGAALSSFGGQIQQFIAQRKAEQQKQQEDALRAKYHDEDTAFREKQFGLQESESKRAMDAFLEGKKQNEFERGTKAFELAGPGGDLDPAIAKKLQELGLPNVTQRTDEMGNSQDSYFRKANPLEQSALNENASQESERSKKAALIAGLNPAQQTRATLGFDPSEPGYAERQKIEQKYALERINAQVGPQLKGQERQVQAEVLRAINSLKQGLDEGPEQYQQRASLIVQQLESMGVKIDDETKKALIGEGDGGLDNLPAVSAPAANGPGLIQKFLDSMKAAAPSKVPNPPFPPATNPF